MPPAIRLAEWLYEAGIGENRAALVEGGEIIEAQIERDQPWPRAGAVCRARFQAPLVGRQTALIKLDRHGEAVLQPVPESVGPGSRFTVEVTREFIFAPQRRLKQMKARVVPDETPLREGSTLIDRVSATGIPVRKLRAFDPDLLEEAGWSELLEEATSGNVTFPGGALRIEAAEAMTLIDVDGVLEPHFLAVDGARAAGKAISRLALTGSIGIDLPTVGDRSVRKRAAEALDDMIPQPFERTAVNGFGFVQVIRRRERASILDLMQGEPGTAAALALYRRAERDPWRGPLEIVAAHDVVASFGRNARQDAELERRRGAPVNWRVVPSLPIWGGYIARIEDDDEED